MNAEITQALSNIKSHLNEYSDKLSSTLEAVAEKSGISIENLKHQAEECQDQVANYVKEKPLAAMAWAAGIGLLVGMLIKR